MQYTKNALHRLGKNDFTDYLHSFIVIEGLHRLKKMISPIWSLKRGLYNIKNSPFAFILFTFTQLCKN